MRSKHWIVDPPIYFVRKLFDAAKILQISYRRPIILLKHNLLTKLIISCYHKFICMEILKR